MRTPAPRTIRRRLLAFTVASAAVLAVAACGADDSGPAGSVGDTRTVDQRAARHEHMTTPTRVVVLEPVQLDTAIALQITPVGAAVLNEAAGVPKYLGDKAERHHHRRHRPGTQRAEDRGPQARPDHRHRVPALRPLPAAHRCRPDRVHGHPDGPVAGQRPLHRDHARRCGLRRKLLTGYQQRCADIAKKFGTAGKSAQLIRPRDGVLTLYGPTSFAGSALECVASRPPSATGRTPSRSTSPPNGCWRPRPTTSSHHRRRQRPQHHPASVTANPPPSPACTWSTSRSGSPGSARSVDRPSSTTSNASSPRRVDHHHTRPRGTADHRPCPRRRTTRRWLVGRSSCSWGRWCCRSSWARTRCPRRTSGRRCGARAATLRSTSSGGNACRAPSPGCWSVPDSEWPGP